jgi:sulfur carrier protein
MRINGENQPQAVGMTVGAYLEQAGFPRTFIAVERNGQIVPKAEYDTTVFQEGDKVEIVRFVGGG